MCTAPLRFARAPMMALLAALSGACADKGPAERTGGEDSGVDAPLDVEIADYDLNLIVEVPENQPDLFDIVAQVDLEITDAEGTLGPFTFTDITAGGGRVADSLPALRAAVFTLRAYDAEGALVSVGRSQPVDATTGAAEVRVFMGRARSIGWIEGIADADGDPRGVYAGALVALGGGRFQLYGGTARVVFGPTPAESADNGVWELDLNQVGGGLRFIRVGDLPAPDPEATDPVPGRAAHTATLLRGDHADDGLVLIAGGATDYLDGPNASNDLTLYDPVNHAIVDRLTLGAPVFQHTATLTADGRVVLNGGSRQNDTPGSIVGSTRIHIYDPSDRSIGVASVSDAPWMWEATAALRDGSVLICGGSIFADTDAELRGCGLITVGGTYVSREDSGITLPEALYHPAMTTLENGDVILVGGFTDLGEAASPRYLADPRVWRLADGSTTWEPLGSLRIARGLASIRALPGGDVLVVGGVPALATQLFPDGDGAISCVERFIVDSGVSKFVPASVETSAGEAAYDCDADTVEGGLRVGAAQVMVGLDPDDTNVLLVGGQADSTPASPQVAIYFPEL